MDAPNPSALPTFASRTPLHVGAVGLKVRDLDRLSQFYRDVLGLSVLDHDKNGATLGAGGVPVIHLEHQPGAKPDDPRTAGLYHTAFLMPTRADLARWILHVARHKVPLTGASDHGVSEAFYLDDPEGNGMEVYSDRPADSWQWMGNELKMITDPLDIDDILREVPSGRDLSGRSRGPAHRPRSPAGGRHCARRDVLSRRTRTRGHAPPPRRELHVVGTLSPPHRRQCLA